MFYQAINKCLKTVLKRNCRKKVPKRWDFNFYLLLNLNTSCFLSQFLVLPSHLLNAEINIWKLADCLIFCACIKTVFFFWKEVERFSVEITWRQKILSHCKFLFYHLDAQKCESTGSSLANGTFTHKNNGFWDLAGRQNQCY